MRTICLAIVMVLPGASATVRAEGAPAVRSFLPAAPVVVPPAPPTCCRPGRCCGATNTTKACNCTQPGFLRCILASGHAFFPMPTGHGFGGLCP